MQHWPPCNEELLRDFKWEALLPPSEMLALRQQHGQLLSPHHSMHRDRLQGIGQSPSDGSHGSGQRHRVPSSQANRQSLPCGQAQGQPSGQGQSSFAGTPAAGSHLY